MLNEKAASRRAVSPPTASACSHTAACTNSTEPGKNRIPKNEETPSTDISRFQLVLYDPSVNWASSSDSARRVQSSTGAFTIQCAECFKWRLIPAKEKYEEIRKHITERPFTCDMAREWKPNISCEDPPDITQDGSRLWAIDKHSVAQRPPERQMLLRNREEGSSRGPHNEPSSRDPILDEVDEHNLSFGDPLCDSYRELDDEYSEESTYEPSDDNHSDEDVARSPPVTRQRRSAPCAPRELPFVGIPQDSTLPFLNRVESDMRADSIDVPVPTNVYGYAEIYVGQLFETKKEMRVVVDDLMIRSRREYKTIENNTSVFSAKCVRHAEGCQWRVRGVFRESGYWEIVTYRDPHSCILPVLSSFHPNLTSKMIANALLSLITADPFIKVKAAREIIRKRYGYNLSYLKVWRGIRIARDQLYGTWESSLLKLPGLMWALQQSNRGTIISLECESGSSPNQRIFKYIFWAFQPCIDGFQHCKPVISVDGTHLYSTYNQKILIAVTQDANQNVLPLAYAIVDADSTESWHWFLQLLATHVVKDRQGICLISDRHIDVESSIPRIPLFNPPLGVHRYCLRHIASNVNEKFRSKKVKKLVYKAGAMPNEQSFRRVMDHIRILNVGAYEYLEQIDKSKWTVAFDGGYRQGTLTTNLSETFNGVLKGARRLPPKAIVESTLFRTVEYFQLRVKNAKEWREKHMWCTRYAWDIYEKNEKLAQSHDVHIFDNSLGTAQVMCGGGGVWHDQHHQVCVAQHHCTCGQWIVTQVPCDHGLAVMLRMNKNMEELVEPKFRLSTYEAQYGGMFYPLLPESYWPTQNIELIPNPLRKKVPRRGRPSTYSK